MYKFCKPVVTNRTRSRTVCCTVAIHYALFTFDFILQHEKIKNNSREKVSDKYFRQTDVNCRPLTDSCRLQGFAVERWDCPCIIPKCSVFILIRNLFLQNSLHNINMHSLAFITVCNSFVTDKYTKGLQTTCLSVTDTGEAFPFVTKYGKLSV
jgi:hypothetical protein